VANGASQMVSLDVGEQGGTFSCVRLASVEQVALAPAVSADLLLERAAAPVQRVTL
jgi:hypothetical protein